MYAQIYVMPESCPKLLHQFSLPPSVCESFSQSTSLPIVAIVNLFHFSSSGDMQWDCVVVLIKISLMTNGVLFHKFIGHLNIIFHEVSLQVVCSIFLLCFLPLIGL